VKYSSLSLTQNDRGLNKILHRMHESFIEYKKAEELKNTPKTSYHQWYLDLKTMIETFYDKNDCVFIKLLEKLADFGKVTFRFFLN
jgi:hypothetical protein